MLHPKLNIHLNGADDQMLDHIIELLTSLSVVADAVAAFESMAYNSAALFSLGKLSSTHTAIHTG